VKLSRAEPRRFDVTRPQAFFVEREMSEAGKLVEVATVFLTNRQCPWRCVYCDLWKNTTNSSVPIGAIPAQIDLVLERLHSKPRHTIKLYNAGSFFDRGAIPPHDYAAIAERVHSFECVIVECHPALVGPDALHFNRLLNHTSGATSSLPRTRLEVAMGLEIASDEILARLHKRMTLALFQRAAGFLANHGIALRVFIMVKPPFVRSESEALDWAKRSIDFAFDCRATAVSLIPARFGPVEMKSLAASGDFAPPALPTLEAALEYGVSLSRGRVFADLWDLEQFKDCDACFTSRRARLEQINHQQRLVPSIICHCTVERSGNCFTSAMPAP
jgi:archaeosine synthase beta-subunit